MPNACNIETFGTHMASDELRQLQTALRGLERRPPSGAKIDSQPSPMHLTQDTELITSKLALEYEERMLELHLRIHEQLRSHAEQRQTLSDEEAKSRARLEATEEDLRHGIAALIDSSFLVVSQREKRRQYNKARLHEVEEWKLQEQRLDEMDADFLANDRARAAAVAVYDEDERQRAEAVHRLILRTDRLMKRADPDDVLQRQLVLERMNLRWTAKHSSSS